MPTRKEEIFDLCLRGDSKALRTLVDTAVAPIKDELGISIAHFAALAGNVEVIIMLKRAGVAFDVASNTGWTPAHAVVGTKNPLAIFAVKEAGGRFNVAETNGWTPAHEVAVSGCPAAIEAAKKAGAKFDVRNIYGSTPLDEASTAPDPDYNEVAIALIKQYVAEEQSTLHEPGK